MAEGKQKTRQGGGDNGATLGFEAKLWQAADKLRHNMEVAEYKHVVLGLIFLKYISDAFEERHAKLAADRKSGADPEDPDEYRAFNIFWVPQAARWSRLQANAKQPTIGQLVAEAYRIRLAHLFGPVLAVHTSLVDPLPHQITAVYEAMLSRQPLRFLLADDPGAGKTIMASLLIKELLARGEEPA